MDCRSRVKLNFLFRWLQKTDCPRCALYNIKHVLRLESVLTVLVFLTFLIYFVFKPERFQALLIIAEKIISYFYIDNLFLHSNLSIIAAKTGKISEYIVLMFKHASTVVKAYYNRHDYNYK